MFHKNVYQCINRKVVFFYLNIIIKSDEKSYTNAVLYFVCFVMPFCFLQGNKDESVVSYII